MKLTTIKLLSIWLLFAGCSAKTVNESAAAPMEEATWKLGWRMVENSWNKNTHLAEIQFDSLLSLNKSIGVNFLISGLKNKAALSKEGEVLRILSNQSDEIQRKICAQQFAKALAPCINLPKEKIKNKKLQLEIIKLFLDDQAVRGNMMKDFIAKYQIDTTKIIRRGEIVVDEKNREQIKEIFWNYGFSNEELEIINQYIDSQPASGISMKAFITKNNFDPATFISPSMGVVDNKNQARLSEIIQEYGFPTRKLIGKDAMRGVFFIIQHADRDKEWQKAQLINIELGAQKGEFSKQNYAYLYDRIQVNSGQKQRYGSQFSKVDRKNKIAELRDTEDLPNLNNRRRAMGMMPIEMYKRRMIGN